MMCSFICCCLRCIPRPPEQCRRLLLAGVWGREETTCGTKVAVCVSKAITYLLGSILSVYLLRLIFFRPYQIRPAISDAILTNFDLDAGDSSLGYGLAMNVAFFNAHRVYSVRFDHLTAALYYNGTRLGGDHGTPQLPDSFTLRPRRRRADRSVFTGRTTDVGAAVADEFSTERNLQGHFTVDVIVKTTLTYKFWPAKQVYYYEYSCGLIFPDPAKVGLHGGAHAVTDDVRCRVTS